MTSYRPQPPEPPPGGLGAQLPGPPLAGVGQQSPASPAGGANPQSPGSAPGGVGQPPGPPGGVGQQPLGPGVQPPFAAPPIDGDRTRVWVGLGLGAAALALCCIVGMAGLGGLVVTSTRAINEQAHVTVRRYLDALIEEDYAAAYGVLCDSLQRRESQRAFTDRVRRSPRVVRYTLDETQIAERIVVPAHVSFTTGADRNLRFVLDQDTTENRLEVCGIE